MMGDVAVDKKLYVSLHFYYQDAYNRPMHLSNIIFFFELQIIEIKIAIKLTLFGLMIVGILLDAIKEFS